MLESDLQGMEIIMGRHIGRALAQGKAVHGSLDGFPVGPLPVELGAEHVVGYGRRLQQLAQIAGNVLIGQRQDVRARILRAVAIRAMPVATPFDAGMFLGAFFLESMLRAILGDGILMDEQGAGIVRALAAEQNGADHAFGYCGHAVHGIVEIRLQHLPVGGSQVQVDGHALAALDAAIGVGNATAGHYAHLVLDIVIIQDQLASKRNLGRIGGQGFQQFRAQAFLFFLVLLHLAFVEGDNPFGKLLFLGPLSAIGLDGFLGGEAAFQVMLIQGRLGNGDVEGFHLAGIHAGRVAGEDHLVRGTAFLIVGGGDGDEQVGPRAGFTGGQHGDFIPLIREGKAAAGVGDHAAQAQGAIERGGGRSAHSLYGLGDMVYGDQQSLYPLLGDGVENLALDGRGIADGSCAANGRGVANAGVSHGFPPLSLDDVRCSV